MSLYLTLFLVWLFGFVLLSSISIYKGIINPEVRDVLEESKETHGEFVMQISVVVTLLVGGFVLLFWPVTYPILLAAESAVNRYKQTLEDEETRIAEKLSKL